MTFTNPPNNPLASGGNTSTFFPFPLEAFMDYTTLENAFISIMTPMSIGFTLLMFSVLVYEYFRILISELLNK